MDYSKNLKFLLEKNDLLSVIEGLRLDKEAFLNSLKTGSNILCSNDSFLFIYFEQNASLLAIGLNYLCKAQDTSFKQSFQLLQLNEIPVGQFKKCLISHAGNNILLVYEKIVYCVELPLKWGKFDLFDGGKPNMICKTIKINPSKYSSIMDVIWHKKSQENIVACLTADGHIRMYLLSKPNEPFKEFFFSNSFDIIPEDSSGPNFLSLDMGAEFEYNGKIVHPIFVLRADSVVECLLDSESHTFDYIGPLSVKPYQEEMEQSNIESFICLPGLPNCLVLFLSNGMIYHTIFIINTENLNFEDDTSNIDNDIEKNGLLLVYESFSLSNNINYKSIKLYRDLSTNSKYFIKHSNGLHSVHIQWFNQLDEAFRSQDLTNFNETNPCELSNLISTNPLLKPQSSNFLAGLTVIFNFGKTSRSLVCLDNQAKFICKNIEFLYREESTETENDFSNYVADILKRDTNMPLLLTNLENDLSETELKMVSHNIVNLIRNEYIERQKNVVLEFQRRNKILKSREKVQYESIKDINSKLSKLNENKDKLNQLKETIVEKQQSLEKRMETIFNNLFVKNKIPLNENEKKVYLELKKMDSNLKESIKKKSTIFDNIKEKQEPVSYDENELEQIKKMLKNE